LGVAERMRVPSPAAITTADKVEGGLMRAKAGAPGFEPGVAGPKPAALPLGYAPKAALSHGDSPAGAIASRPSSRPDPSFREPGGR
jgi:hypothetical protein